MFKEQTGQIIGILMTAALTSLSIVFGVSGEVFWAAANGGIAVAIGMICMASIIEGIVFQKKPPK